jgi:hypothetical protein
MAGEALSMTLPASSAVTELKLCTGCHCHYETYERLDRYESLLYPTRRRPWMCESGATTRSAQSYSARQTFAFAKLWRLLWAR